MTQTVLENTAVSDRSEDGYDEFSAMIRQNFANAVENNKYLFTTSAVALFATFLDGLPQDACQHYTCNCCRKFIETYGGLVTIDEKGFVTPAIWPLSNSVPPIFVSSVAWLRQHIKEAEITGVFLTDAKVWGTPVTGDWHHMHVVPPKALLHTSRLQTPFQTMAAKKEDYVILCRSLAEFTASTTRQAINLLRSEALYRSEKCLGVAEWFLKLHDCLAAAKNDKARSNLIWLAVASAPTGFCHIRSSMIGTLLDDISEGLSFDAVSRRFAEKMSPANYQRAQVAPTVGGVQQAEKLIAKLGLENSLQRRYMTIEEIPEFVWRRRDVPEKVQAGGVFAGVVTKQKAKPQATGMELPTVTMTWRKFSETVLPTATKIEIKDENSNRFAALVTALHPDSESILQWDNGASWYYYGGADAEIKQRVQAAGGRYDDNEIRCSLIWNNYTDLDLHCITPLGEHIYFANKRDSCGGWLDVDANGGGRITTEPVENIRWSSAPVGNYQFYIHNYSERANRQNLYKAELEINGKIFTFEGVAGDTGSKINLATFVYQKGVTPTIQGNMSVTNGIAWSIEMNKFHEVTGIVKSPNLWGDKPVEHAGDHTFFVVKDCWDTEEGKGRGFFNEMLKPELREIRKTLEAYTANTPVLGHSTASGLGYSKSSEWNATVRVTSNLGVATYKIDRWD